MIKPVRVSRLKRIKEATLTIHLSLPLAVIEIPQTRPQKTFRNLVTVFFRSQTKGHTRDGCGPSHPNPIVAFIPLFL